MMKPVPGKIADLLFGQKASSPVSKRFTPMISLANILESYFCSPKWTEEEFFAIEKQTNTATDATS